MAKWPSNAWQRPSGKMEGHGEPVVGSSGCHVMRDWTLRRWVQLRLRHRPGGGVRAAGSAAQSAGMAPGRPYAWRHFDDAILTALS